MFNFNKINSISLNFPSVIYRKKNVIKIYNKSLKEMVTMTQNYTNVKEK